MAPEFAAPAAAAAVRPLDPRGVSRQIGGMERETLSRADHVRPFAAPDPEVCRDMADVRLGVDEIDRMLVALIKRRQGYMDAAARIKEKRETVRDEGRIREVLSKVRAEAERCGLSWSIAEPVWREMMERCIAYEFDVWDALRRRSAQSG